MIKLKKNYDKDLYDKVAKQIEAITDKKVKEKLKDEVMKSNSSSFNYLKIVEKDNIKFFKYLELAKEKFVNNDNSAIFMV